MAAAIMAALTRNFRGARCHQRGVGIARCFPPCTRAYYRIAPYVFEAVALPKVLTEVQPSWSHGFSAPNAGWDSRSLIGNGDY